MFSNPAVWLQMGMGIFMAAYGIGCAVSSIIRAKQGRSRNDDL